MSCVAKKDLVKVKFTPDKWSPKYFIKVPKGYNDRNIIIGGNEYEMLTYYPDSSIIYIANTNTPSYNYKNILNLGDSIANYRFQNVEIAKETNQLLGKEAIKVLSDTFELSGVDSNLLYWKDLKLGELSVGYAKVPKEKKELFDKSLKTLKIK